MSKDKAHRAPGRTKTEGEDALSRLRRLEAMLMQDSEYALRAARYGIAHPADRGDGGDEYPEDRVTALERFARAVFAGVYPTPEVLLLVASALNVYTASKGKLSLEKAFHLRSVQRAGNQAEQLADSRMRERFYLEMAHYRATHPRASLEKAAEAARNALPIHVDYKTMARSYSKKGWRVVENLISEKYKEEWGAAEKPHL